MQKVCPPKLRRNLAVPFYSYSMLFFVIGLHSFYVIVRQHTGSYIRLYDCSKLAGPVDRVPQSSAHSECRNRQLLVLQQPRTSCRQGMCHTSSSDVRACVCGVPLRRSSVRYRTPVRSLCRRVVDRAALLDSRH
jgi:hypothetical protein